MRGVFEFPAALRPVQRSIDDALARVETRFDHQLASHLPAVQRLVAHVERYRGKMLRPSVAVLSGLACDERSADMFKDEDGALLVSDDLVTIGAVCEMVHMATLVHDDVLDEADVRRRGETVNKLRGNEAAVLLGDYMIAGAFELCSQLQDQSVALAIGRMSMELCAGELLQNDNRDSYSLDEATYFEIVGRKTGSLIAAACRLGASHAEQPIDGLDSAAEGFGAFGERIGVAFQIQDDLLDLLGEQRKVGKSVNKDLEKGKMTLPMIHHLARVEPEQRGRSLALLEQAGTLDETESQQGSGSRVALVEALNATGSIAFAESEAERLVAEAKDAIDAVPESLPKLVLMLMADAVVSRSF